MGQNASSSHSSDFSNRSQDAVLLSLTEHLRERDPFNCTKHVHNTASSAIRSRNRRHRRLSAERTRRALLRHFFAASIVLASTVAFLCKWWFGCWQRPASLRRPSVRRRPFIDSIWGFFVRSFDSHPAFFTIATVPSRYLYLSCHITCSTRSILDPQNPFPINRFTGPCHSMFWWDPKHNFLG